ncbi:MAG: ribulokinase [Clostridia bacterium]|nr:ribulokinase [Clostridia bacterium]
MSKFAVGVDFGTLSARALVAETGTGRELASAVMNYPHAVMDERLPDGAPLPPDWALQHPGDYLLCLKTVVPEALRKAGVSAEDVVGIGVDFTASTVMPVTDDLTPLCLLPEFTSRPHAYVKLWKHHGGQDEANRMTETARICGETFLARYGNKVSSEWMIPKIWETLNKDPEIYDRAARFIDAGDWLVSLLVGREVRSASIAGFKAFWQKDTGYPSEEYFAALDPRLKTLVRDKLGPTPVPVNSRAGELTETGASMTGLLPGTAVAVAQIDAHVAIPPTGIAGSGRMLMIMGTSTCHLMLSDESHIVPGMCGAVEDSVVPGLLCYEAGQSCVGDSFNWFAERCVPEEYMKEARSRNLDAHRLLTEKAALLRPGESGLIALDWWNGNRSVLVDADLTGMIIGLTLTTKPEEIYRALIESTAYGTRMIAETFERHGVVADSLYACGGIAQKNAFLMQIYADVLGREIRIARSAQTPALGAAMLGAVAAGSAAGGYDCIEDAAREMGGTLETIYRPNPAAHAVYDRLYREYAALHDFFGRGGNDVMKRLKQIRSEAR